MTTDQSFRQAQGAALRLLSYRPRSEAELRGRLSRRFPSHTVDGVLRSLKRQSLVDDQAFDSANFSEKYGDGLVDIEVDSKTAQTLRATRPTKP